MQHHDDIGPSCQRCRVAGLLVGAIAAVPIMADRWNTEFLGQLDRVVVARVVDQNDIVDDFVRNFVKGSLEPLRGVVCGQHYRDLPICQHRNLWGASTESRLDQNGFGRV
jgi:hypothetical protein